MLIGYVEAKGYLLTLNHIKDLDIEMTNKKV